MTFIGIGLMELLLLVGASGLPVNDLLSLVAPDDYFSARDIPLNAEEMTKLAGKDPGDARTQVRQLLAIRWLGENPAATRRAGGARALLEEIAAGKKAQDRHGFAKGHAQRALALLDGKTPPSLATMPAGSLKKDALTWFPKDLNIALGIDLRGDQFSKDTALVLVRGVLKQAIRPADRKNFYDVIDRIGNVRLDRVTAAGQLSANGQPNQFIVRLSAALEPKWIIDALEGPPFNEKVEKKKGPSGESISIFSSVPGNRSMAAALVGDGEFLLLHDDAGGKPLDLLDRVLAAKNGKQKNLTEGPLGALAEKFPARARVVMLTQIPEAGRKQFTQGGSPFKTFPEQFLFHGVREKQALAVAEGFLGNKEEAQGFAEALKGLKQQALQGLAAAPADAPKELVQSLKQMLESLKVEADGSAVKTSIQVDEDALSRALLLMLGRGS